jgi:hypothetical protein
MVLVPGWRSISKTVVWALSPYQRSRPAEPAAPFAGKAVEDRFVPVVVVGIRPMTRVLDPDEVLPNIEAGVSEGGLESDMRSVSAWAT